jgi:hypothetical protein
MARKKHSAEQIVALLRQIEVELANHKSIGQACCDRLPSSGLANTAKCSDPIPFSV